MDRGDIGRSNRASRKNDDSGSAPGRKNPGRGRCVTPKLSSAFAASSSVASATEIAIGTFTASLLLFDSSRSSSVQMAPVAPQPMPAGRLDADVSGRFRLDVHLAQVIAAVNTPNLRDRAPDTLNASSRRRRYLTTRSSLKRRRKANTVSPSCSDAMFSKRAVSSGCSTGGPTSLYASCRRPSPMVPFDRIESSRRTVWPLSSWWSLMTARRWSGACRRAGSSAARRRA